VISTSLGLVRKWLFKHRLIVLPMLALVSSACFCQYDPYAHLIATKKPQAQNVVGVYFLKTQTLTDEELNFLEGAQATIELDSSGVYTATNFPVWREFGAGYRFDLLFSTTHNWQIDATGSISGETAWGIRLTPALDPLALSPDITNNTPPHGLLFTYGDPDSGDVMIFERGEEK
jgi:hypothetical protein